MRETSSIAVNPGNVFEIAYAPAIPVEITLAEGWNLVGSGVMSRQSVDEIFAGSVYASGGVDVVWHWNDERYEIWPLNEPLSPERGYCVYSSAVQTTVSIAGVRADGVMMLKPGWNLVSPPSDSVMPAVGGMPGKAWRLNDNTYQVVASGDLLKAGQGYWIFVQSPEPLLVDFGQ